MQSSTACDMWRLVNNDFLYLTLTCTRSLSSCIVIAVCSCTFFQTISDISVQEIISILIHILLSEDNFNSYFYSSSEIISVLILIKVLKYFLFTFSH
jgi:hypothetical protein